MIFTPSSVTILIIIYIFGFIVGRKTSCMIWKASFEKFTNEVYDQYKSILKDKDDEIKRLNNKIK